MGNLKFWLILGTAGEKSFKTKRELNGVPDQLHETRPDGKLKAQEERGHMIVASGA